MSANTLVWDGSPGHYEVYYLTLTDPGSETGLWIRYTMKAPVDGDAECSLWFLAMRPDGTRFGAKETFPIDQLVAENEPFRLRVGDSILTDTGMTGHMAKCAWDLSWQPRLPVANMVHPLFRRAKIAKTIFTVPNPDVAISGTVSFDGTALEIDGARGGQAHLWGTKHAQRWAWGHCNDFVGVDGSPRPDSFWEAASVFVPRFGREIGPNTPVVARVCGEDFSANGILQVTRNASSFGLTQWRCEATSGKRRLVAEWDAPRASLVGVTYQDPDGDPAYCYNSEVATLRLQVYDKGGDGWTLTDTLVSENRAHFEYAQREKVDGVELLTT